MAIELDPKLVEQAWMASRPWTMTLPDFAIGIETYLNGVWRPIDDGAKTGKVIVLRRGGVIRSAVWAYPELGDCDWWKDACAEIWIDRDWPTHYAPLAALVDLEG